MGRVNYNAQLLEEIKQIFIKQKDSLYKLEAEKQSLMKKLKTAKEEEKEALFKKIDINYENLKKLNEEIDSFYSKIKDLLKNTKN